MLENLPVCQDCDDFVTLQRQQIVVSCDDDEGLRRDRGGPRPVFRENNRLCRRLLLRRSDRDYGRVDLQIFFTPLFGERHAGHGCAWSRLKRVFSDRGNVHAATHAAD